MTAYDDRELIRILLDIPADHASWPSPREMRRIKLREGDIFYEAGSPADTFYMVPSTYQRAAVELKLPGSSGSSAVERVLGGDLFGEIEYLSIGPRKGRPLRLHTAIALADVEVVELAYSSLERLEVSSGHQVVRALAIRAVERIRRYGALIVGTRFSDKAAQLGLWLLETAEDVGVREASGYRVRMKFNQADIGNAVGLSREAVSLQFTEWERSGLILRDRSGLVLCDPDRLRRILRSTTERGGRNHADMLAEVDRCIDRGDELRARNLCVELLRHFPRSGELQHRLILVTARMGWTDEALRLVTQFGFELPNDIEAFRSKLLSGLVAPGNRRRSSPADDALEDEIEDIGADAAAVASAARHKLPALVEDVLCLKARLLKDMALEHGRAEGRLALLLEAEAIYARAHALTGGFYSAINSACMSFLAGNAGAARRKAQSLLTTLSGDGGFWQLAAAAECQVLLGQSGKAEALLRQAAAARDASESKFAAVRRQFRFYADHGKSGVAEALSGLPWTSIGFVLPDCPRPSTASTDLAEREDPGLPDQLFLALDSNEKVEVGERALTGRTRLHLVAWTPSVEHGHKNRAEPDAAVWTERMNDLVARAGSVFLIGNTAPRLRQKKTASALLTAVAAGHAILMADRLEGDLRVVWPEKSVGEASAWCPCPAGSGEHLPGRVWQCLSPLLVKTGALLVFRVPRSLDVVSSLIREWARHSARTGSIMAVTETLVLGPDTVCIATGDMDSGLALLRHVNTRLAEIGPHWQILADVDSSQAGLGEWGSKAAQSAAAQWSGYSFPLGQVVLTPALAALLRLAGARKGELIRLGRLDPERGRGTSGSVPSRLFFGFRPAMIRR